MTEKLIQQTLNETGFVEGAELLRSATHAIALDPAAPILLGYRSLVSGDQLLGDPEARPPLAVLADSSDAERASDSAGFSTTYTVERDGESVSYRAEVTCDGSPAAEYALRFSLDGSDLAVELTEVVEHPGFHLIHVDLRRVLSAHTAHPASRMLVGTGAGRLADPAGCEPGEYFHKYSWTRDSFSTVGLVYNTSLTGVLRLESLDDTILSSVAEHDGAKSAGLGVQLRYRCPSPKSELRFRPHPTTRAIIHLLDEETGSPERGWLPGARYVRGLLGEPRPDLYRDQFIYKVFVGCPSEPEQTSFDQALELVRKIHNLTDGAKQIPYLVGWQHRGHDTGYPDVFTVNEVAGGKAALERLLEEGKTLNATVSFHDNYDDAYDNSPMWDPDDVSTDREGGLLKGGVWNDVQCYWISMPVYAEKKAPERVRRTLAQLPIPFTYHLDVLTASVFRVDYRPDSPTGKDGDLAGRVAIVEEFRKRGVDVTSEACGLPFLNAISYFWHHPRERRPAHEGDRPVPFGPFIAHGHVGYGGSHVDEAWEVLDALLYGAFYSQDLTPKTPTKEILDAFYLLQTPLNALRAERIVDYIEDGTRKRVEYSEGSSVEVDFESLGHEVRIGGARVLKDFTCFAPGAREGAYLCYRSRERDPLWWDLPAEWSGAEKLSAVALTETGEGETCELAVENGRALLDVEVGVPYRITRV